VVDATEDRERAVEHLGSLLGPAATEVLDQLMPRKPWRTTIPATEWRRPEVLDEMIAFGPRRRRLHARLIELLGEDDAGTLMEYVLPASWRDLDRMGVPLDRLL
jgi:hypothetical protein